MGRKSRSIALATLASVLLAALCVYLGWFLAGVRETPTAGLRIAPGEADRAEQATRRSPVFEPSAVLQVVRGGPADRAGIEPGDIVLDIAGVPPHDAEAMRELAARTRPGDPLAYRVLRGGRTVDLELTTESALRMHGFRVDAIGSGVMALIFLSIALLLFVKRATDARALVFFLMSHAFAALYLIGPALGVASGAPLGNLDPGAWLPHLPIQFVLYLVAAFLVSSLLLHLALVFPKPRPVLRDYPLVFRWVYGLPVIFLAAGFWTALASFVLLRAREGILLPLRIGAIAAVLAFLASMAHGYLRAARREGLKRAMAARPWTTILAATSILPLCAMLSGSAAVALGHTRYVPVALTGALIAYLLLASSLPLLVYPVATCVSMYRSYRESPLEERTQVRWPLWGTILALAGVAATGIPSLVLSFLPASGGIGWGAALETVGKAFYVLIPLSFAVAILKYRLMDIDLILRRTLVYSVLTGVILAVYVTIVGGLGTLAARWVPVQGEWFTVSATLAIAAILVPARNRVQSFIDRRFFRRRFDYPEALNAFASRLPHAQDRNELARIAAEQVQQAVQLRSVAVFLPGGADGAWRVAAKVGLSDEIARDLRLESTSPFPAGLAGIEEVRLGILPVEEREVLRRARAAVVVPVRTTGPPLGFLALGTKLSGEAIDGEDRGFLESVASQLAIAADSLRLRAQEHDFEAAREIQRRLLPVALPRIPGVRIAAASRPSRAIGGDYYDVFDFGEGRVGLCIADVAGKGMPAALLMSNLQAAVRALAGPEVRPADLAAQLNRILCSNVVEGKFVTFFWALLDVGAGRLVCTNAGHNPPALLRRDRSRRRLRSGGMVLGAFAENDYDQEEVAVGAGDRLVLFTDGISEATDDDDEEFGEDRLLDLAARDPDADPAAILHESLDEVSRFARGSLADDATLLVVAIDAAGSKA